MDARQHKTFIDAEIYRIRFDEVRVSAIYDIACVSWVVEEFCKLHRVIDELDLH